MDMAARVERLEKLLALTEMQVSHLSAGNADLGQRLAAAAKDFAAMRAQLDASDGEIRAAYAALRLLLRMQPDRDATRHLLENEFAWSRAFIDRLPEASEAFDEGQYRGEKLLRGALRRKDEPPE